MPRVCIVIKGDGKCVIEDHHSFLEKKRYVSVNYVEPFQRPIQIQEVSLPFSHEFTATRGISLPSPTSAGVSTRRGSGQSTTGTEAGPKRPWRPRDLSFKARSTFSGVIGTSSIRTPTALYTAFATAGGTGNKGPCPTSFAPYGPFGAKEVG